MRYWVSGLLLTAGVVAIAVAATPQTTSDEHARWPAFEKMHEYYLAAFNASDSFGDKRLADEKISIDASRRYVGDTYVLKDLGLIGLAKHKPPKAPVVFLDKTAADDVIVHRRIDPGSWLHPTRELTMAEQLALDALKQGSELFVEQEGDGQRVVGAVRASDRCLRCHEGSRHGDVLGAFTYRLVPLKPVAQKTNWRSDY